MDSGDQGSRTPSGRIKDISRDQSLHGSTPWKATAPSTLRHPAPLSNEAKKRFTRRFRRRDLDPQWMGARAGRLSDDIVARRRTGSTGSPSAACWNSTWRPRASLGRPVMQSLDLAYHDVDPESASTTASTESGEMRRLVRTAH